MIGKMQVVLQCQQMRYFTPLESGTYTVTISVPPCSETTVSIDVVVKPVPDLRSRRRCHPL